MRSKCSALTVFVSIALGLGAQTVAAQTVETEYNVERFRLSSDRNGILDVELAEVIDHMAVDIGAWFGYADDPLNVYQDTADGRERVGSIVSGRLGGNLMAAIGLFDRVEIGLDLPLVLSQSNELGDFMSVSGSIKSFGLGDLRLNPKLAILRGDTTLSVALGLTLPTATSEDYFGNGQVTFAPEILVSHRFGDRLRAGINLGYRARENRMALDLEVDDEIFGHVGVGYFVTDMLELDGTFALATAASDFVGRFNSNHSEVRAGIAAHLGGRIVPFAAAGLGTSEGFGTPDWRVLVGIRLGLLAPADEPMQHGTMLVDSDGDGLTDDVDSCPQKPENINGVEDSDGCPEEAIANSGDRDGDGMLDENDSCPDDSEDLDNFEDMDGCPDPDNDNDGVLDGDDQCVNQPGTVANIGCPDLDSDGDTVVDRLDNCPEEAGDPANQGCKKKQLVKIVDGRLDILDQVYFRTNKAIIRQVSYPLLDNVARVLNAHLEISKVRVEGHTDSQGGDNYNLKLSQRRADAVRQYLVDKGVDADRLEAVGYGETKPIQTNDTKVGRAANRRVVFNLLGRGDGVGQQGSGPTGDTIDR